MSCHGHYARKTDCVCSTVKEIIAIQNRVLSNKRCESSCEESIKQLKSPAKPAIYNKTTIPFILFCKGNCKLFIASGVFKSHDKECHHHSFFDCLETPIFRAVKSDGCCVKLELLQPVNKHGIPVTDSGDNICDFFCYEKPYRTTNFRHTAICITVDLNDFTGIQCLDPVKPLPAH